MTLPGNLSKLRIAFLLPVLAALAVAAPLFWALSRGPVEETSSNLLAETLAIVEPHVLPWLGTLEGASLRDAVEELRGPSTLRFTLIAESGLVLADTTVPDSLVPEMENHRQRPEIAEAFENGRGSSLRRSATTGSDYLYVARRLEGRDGGIYVLRIARRVDHGRSLRSGLGGAVLLALTAALLLVSAIVLWLDRKLVQPFEQLVDGARRLSAGQFSHRVARPEADELVPLAESLNHLATEVESSLRLLESERDHLHRILSTLSDGILVVDDQARVVLENEAVDRLLGPPADEGWLLAQRRPGLSTLLSSAQLEGQSRQHRLELRDPLVILRITALPFQEARGAVLVVHDETESLLLAESRKDLVANVSHELKTPLTAIRGFAETLDDGALEDPETARRFTGRILEQCQRLEHLLRDLLSLSRAESLELETPMRSVMLGQIIDQALAILEPRIREKGIEIERSEEGETEIVGDPAGLEQLVTNLLENAVEYNRANGQVRIRLWNDDDVAELVVADTGIGIPPEDRDRIFERFYRVDKARSRDLGGTGLGLAIVKHVALRHGGTIEVDSEVGRGTTFRVRLPVVPPEPPVARGTREPRQSPRP